MPLIPVAYLGHAAGLATSVLWTGTSMLFTAAGRRLGATVVNTMRILIAVALQCVTHRLVTGAWIPAANGRQILLLAGSGLLGLAIGDQALLTAFVEIGPRVSLLIMTTAPLFAALFGWIMLGETLTPVALVGITLTTAGVAWVVLERPTAATGTTGGRRARGILLAFVGAICQAAGLLLSKAGIGHGWLPEDQYLKPQAASFVRTFFAALGVLPILAAYALRERGRRAAGIYPVRIGSRWTGALCAFGGSLVGPYLGVWMSLEAAHRVSLGVAQTLCSLPPVFILPFARFIHHERISARAVIGALVAVGGVAMLLVLR